MAVIATSAGIGKRFADYEWQRESILESLTALEEEQWLWSPKADVWSIAQIVEHLVLSDEQVGCPQERAQVASEPLLFRLVPRRVRRAFILRAFQNDRVLPLPSPTLEPRGGVGQRELIARWDAVRGEMRRDLAALSEDARYAHRLLGPLTAVQMLEIGWEHVAYHRRQIEAVQRQIAARRAVAAS